MPVRSRGLWVAVGAGFVAATASTMAVFALLDRGPAVDGEAVLDEPGIYAAPVVSVPVTGEIVPDVELVDVEGESVSLSSFRGRPLVVNVWYTTCAPCAREVGDFAAVHADLGDDIQFVGIDPIDELEPMVAFAEARDVGYTLLRDPARAWVRDLPVAAYPTTLFVSADGEILRQTTALDATELRAILAELF